MKKLMILALLLASIVFAANAAAGPVGSLGHQDHSQSGGNGGGDEGDNHDGHGNNGGDNQDGHGNNEGGKGRSATSGPHRIVTTDNGSCSQPWAVDTIDRTYTVRANGDGTFSIVETDRGTFTTTGPVSPGACNETGSYPPQPSSNDHGHVVLPGIRGYLVGFMSGVITCTPGPCAYNGAAVTAACSAPGTCTRSVYLAAAFGPTARWSCLQGQNPCQYRFDYYSPDPRLIYRHWVDQGTGTTERFSGDIATA